MINENQDIEDDTLSDQVIEDSMDAADAAVLDLLTFEPEGTDNTAIVFGVWHSLMIQLHRCGWTKADLMRELSSLDSADVPPSRLH